MATWVQTQRGRLTNRSTTCWKGGTFVGEQPLRMYGTLNSIMFLRVRSSTGAHQHYTIPAKALQRELCLDDEGQVAQICDALKLAARETPEGYEVIIPKKVRSDSRFNKQSKHVHGNIHCTEGTLPGLQASRLSACLLASLLSQILKLRSRYRNFAEDAVYTNLAVLHGIIGCI